MNVEPLLKQALEERDLLLEAMAALEQLARTRGLKRPGRPPKWLVESRKVQAPRRKKDVARAAPSGKSPAASLAQA